MLIKPPAKPGTQEYKDWEENYRPPRGQTIYKPDGFDISKQGIDAGFNQGPNDSRSFIQAFRDELGPAPQIDYQPSLYDKFKDQRPENIAGLSDDYFSSQKESRLQSLRDEFFGPLGVLNKQASAEMARGGLGSGVGRRVLENTVTNPFMQSQVKVQSDVAEEQMKERARVDELNAQRQGDWDRVLATLAQTDSTNLLEADKANQTIKATYDDLAARLGDAAAGRLDEWQMKKLEADLRLFEMAEERIAKQKDIDLQRDRMSLEYPA